jgi:DNA-binding beta-propeller fold protein YncE
LHERHNSYVMIGLMRTMLAAILCWCFVGGCAAQVLATKTYGTDGHPTEAIWTPDWQYVLVTVNREHGLGSGIEVFRAEPEKLKKVAFQPLGAEMAQGILLIPHTQMLAVGISNAGVAFLPLQQALVGKATPMALPQGQGSGSGYLAVTPDGQTLFVANEYGQGGNIGVIALHREDSGAVHPAPVAQLHTPRATPGVSITADGTRVYTVGEVIPEGIAARIPGNDAPELHHDGCHEGPNSNTDPNGALYVIDAAKAAQLSPTAGREEMQAAVPGIFNAGCSPVREVASSDGKTLYVTVRGDNKVLVFDAQALESDRKHAFVTAVPSGGEAPVGVALFDGSRKMLVANSNRFAGGSGNATVFDVTDRAKPIALQTIKTGEFPRNITASPDGRSLLLTVFSSDELMVLTQK